MCAWVCGCCCGGEGGGYVCMHMCVCERERERERLCNKHTLIVDNFSWCSADILGTMNV